MTHSFTIARDHLKRAATILEGQDNQSREVRYIIERTITLMDDLQIDLGHTPLPAANVLDFASFRARLLRPD